MTRPAYVYSTLRTPRTAAKPTGGLHPLRPVELVGRLLDAAAERGLDPSAVDDMVLGCNTAIGDQGANVAQTALRYAGWPHRVGGATVNRFCASGLDAAHTAAARVMAGMDELILAGGVESMSRVPMFSDKGAWFADPEVARRSGFLHMGVAADLLATLHGIDRTACDAFAAESHRRAAAARDAGRFTGIVAIEVPGEDGATLVEHDECIRETSVQKLAALAPAFVEAGAAGSDATALRAYPTLDAVSHVHTVGTSPGMVDAASLVLIGSEAAGSSLGMRPVARIRGFAHVNVEPTVMLTGPAPAIQKACAKAGVAVSDIERFECNESFAATAIHARRELGLDANDERFNAHGGAISLGHPLGATGGILLGMALEALTAADASLAAVAIPAGGGIAAATVIERV